MKHGIGAWARARCAEETRPTEGHRTRSATQPGLLLTSRHRWGGAPPLAPPVNRLGRIFFHAFGQSKFSLAPLEPISSDQKFFGTSKNSAPFGCVCGGGGGGATHRPPTPLKGALDATPPPSSPLFDRSWGGGDHRHPQEERTEGATNFSGGPMDTAHCPRDHTFWGSGLLHFALAHQFLPPTSPDFRRKCRRSGCTDCARPNA